MENARKAIPGSKVVGVLCVSALFSPVWMLTTPPFWIDHDDIFEVLAPYLFGSLLVGTIYLLIAWWRSKPPSPLFALVLPMIGALGYALIQPLLTPFYPYYYDVFSHFYMAMLWAYLFGSPIALPVGLLHTCAIWFSLGGRLKDLNRRRA